MTPPAPSRTAELVYRLAVKLEQAHAAGLIGSTHDDSAWLDHPGHQADAEHDLRWEQLTFGDAL
jgi:hypothetical protein